MRLESLFRVDGNFFQEALGVWVYFKWEEMEKVIYGNQTQRFPQLLTQPDLLLGRKSCFLKNEGLSQIKLY